MKPSAAIRCLVCLVGLPGLLAGERRHFFGRDLAKMVADSRCGVELTAPVKRKGACQDACGLRMFIYFSGERLLSPSPEGQSEKGYPTNISPNSKSCVSRLSFLCVSDFPLFRIPLCGGTGELSRPALPRSRPNVASHEHRCVHMYICICVYMIICIYIYIYNIHTYVM